MVDVDFLSHWNDFVCHNDNGTLKDANMPHAILISFVIAVGVGIVYAVRQRTHAMQLSREVSKRLLKTNEHCDVCDKPFYTCLICGCQFDKEIDARRCYDWDLVLRRKHTHQYPHHHDEE